MAEDTEEQQPELDKVRDNSRQEDFIMKNKVYEMILYGSPALEQFPKAEKYTLGKDIRQTMYNILRLVIMLENKHYKKTTLGELDTELDVLRHFVRLAADDKLHADKKPCLPFRKYEIWSRKIDEIGRMIGGYQKSISQKEK